jgi:hypothetical protein
MPKDITIATEMGTRMDETADERKQLEEQKAPSH